MMNCSQAELSCNKDINQHLLGDDGAWWEVERRVAVGIVQIEQIDGIPAERVEKRLLRPPRPVAPDLPPEVPRVEHAP